MSEFFGILEFSFVLQGPLIYAWYFPVITRNPTAISNFPILTENFPISWESSSEMMKRSVKESFLKLNKQVIV